MYEFCIIAILNCSSVWFTFQQFTIGMLGPGVRGIQQCKVDYVSIYYYDNTYCEGSYSTDCLWSFDDTMMCDFPIPDDWFVACAYRDEFEQESFCGELFDFDNDYDVDLLDFAELQNER